MGTSAIYAANGDRYERKVRTGCTHGQRQLFFSFLIQLIHQANRSRLLWFLEKKKRELGGNGLLIILVCSYSLDIEQ